MPKPVASPVDLPLTREEIDAALAKLPGWKFTEHTLAKTFVFPTFRHAIVFIHQSSFVAEELDHHPDWSNNYDSVHVQLTTHHAGHRVTHKDVTLAMNLQLIARGRECSPGCKASDMARE